MWQGMKWMNNGLNTEDSGACEILCVSGSLAAGMKRDHWEQGAQARTCRGSASCNNVNALY